jgi:dihydrofolate synthase/folylpolyglutamate synthase
MQINGEPISDSELAEITAEVKPIADAMKDKPTEFELITAIALLYFKRHECDVVVFEVGMGGRLDSTNVIDTALLSVITGIALDHTAFLGDTVEKIAAEKAGIIKSGTPVLFGGEDTAAEDVIRKAASVASSPYSRADYSKLNVRSATLDGCTFDYRDRSELHISLLGLYQPKNAALVCDAVDILRDGGLDIPERALRDGLGRARWQARFEIIERDPLVIFDGAHNPQGIDVAVKSVEHYFGEQKVAVLTGVLADKDYAYIASRLASIADKAFTMTPDNPRALSAKDYAECLRGVGVSAKDYATLNDAYIAAVEYAKATAKPLVCLGSLYTYSELMKLF